jgi:outer membrane protein assembly factor BamD (BamD/ComL family)
MRRKAVYLRIPIVLAILLATAGGSAYAEWTWTPEVGRWINPGRQPRETAALQFQYAETLLADGDTEKAISEYEKVLRYFPDSNYCDLAQYSIGRALEAQDDHRDAVDAYQKVINEYPNTRLFDKVLEKQRSIADHFFQLGVERQEKFILLRGSGFDRAIETYRKIIDNQPFSDFAAEAQYRIGLSEAAFGTASCTYSQALPCEYDQTAVEGAISKYNYFLRNFPDSSRADEAREKIRELEEIVAEHEFEVAMYYHHKMRYESARMYLDSIVREYPETKWAKKAGETLGEMP